MPNVPLDLFGESYESRTKPLEYQRTINLYPEITSSGKGGLMSWPGKSALSAAIGTNIERGFYDFDGTYVQVVQTSLYSVDMATGVRTTLGTIDGTTRCVFASNAGLLVIANGSGKVYQYNGTALTEITDSDLESPYFVDHLNNQWIFGNDGTTGRWMTSDAGVPSSVSGLNIATAESKGDVLYRPYVFKQQLLLFGRRSMEPWWNTGNGNPPFDRQEGGIIEKGLGANYSIAHSDESLYFLGDDLKVYQFTGGQSLPVSTDGIGDAIQSYGTVDDCIGNVIQIGNQDIYIMQFPTESVTWAYSQQKNFWFQLSSGTQYGAYDGQSYAFFDGSWYVSESSGKISKLEKELFSEDTSTFIRERITKSYDSEAFGVSGMEVFWNSLNIRCTTGEGLSTGQGSDPLLMVYYSDDDGRTWEGHFTLSLGQLGDYQQSPEIHGLGSSYRRKWRFRVSDPVNFNLFEIKANVDLGIE